MSIEQSTDHGYFSHHTLLSAALVVSKWHYPTYHILEMGSGFGSTPLIKYSACGRTIYTVDTDPEWLALFKSYESRDHHFHQIQEIKGVGTGINGWLAAWDQFELPDQIGVAFIDGWPGEARVPLIKRLKGKAKIVIAHDIEADEPGAGGNYGWKQLDGLFAYTTTFKRIRPWTRLYTDESQCFLGLALKDCDSA